MGPHEPWTPEEHSDRSRRSSVPARVPRVQTPNEEKASWIPPGMNCPTIASFGEFEESTCIDVATCGRMGRLSMGCKALSCFELDFRNNLNSILAVLDCHTSRYGLPSAEMRWLHSGQLPLPPTTPGGQRAFCCSRFGLRCGWPRAVGSPQQFRTQERQESTMQWLELGLTEQQCATGRAAGVAACHTHRALHSVA